MEYIEKYETVKCPLTGNFEKVWYRRITETAFFECIGCDNRSQNEKCLECMQQVTGRVNP